MSTWKPWEGMKVHLDTDFGGDPDDACAMAMLLGWPGIEIIGSQRRSTGTGGERPTSSTASECLADATSRWQPAPGSR